MSLGALVFPFVLLHAENLVVQPPSICNCAPYGYLGHLDPSSSLPLRLSQSPCHAFLLAAAFLLFVSACSSCYCWTDCSWAVTLLLGYRFLPFPLRPLLPDDPRRFHQRKAAAAPATTSSTGKLVCGSFTTISTGFSLSFR